MNASKPESIPYSGVRKWNSRLGLGVSTYYLRTCVLKWRARLCRLVLRVDDSLCITSVDLDTVSNESIVRLQSADINPMLQSHDVKLLH